MQITQERFTPGPWRLDETDPHTFEVIGRPTGFCADIVISGYVENRYDARLIAAAPELYASVIELLGPLEAASAAMVEQGMALNEAGEAAFDRARAALAKARGEQA